MLFIYSCRLLTITWHLSIALPCLFSFLTSPRSVVLPIFPGFKLQTRLFSVFSTFVSCPSFRDGSFRFFFAMCLNSSHSDWPLLLASCCLGVSGWWYFQRFSSRAFRLCRKRKRVAQEWTLASSTLSKLGRMNEAQLSSFLQEVRKRSIKNAYRARGKVHSHFWDNFLSEWIGEWCW